MAQTQNLVLCIIAQRGQISGGELLEMAQKFGRSPDAVQAAANRTLRIGLLIRKGCGRGRRAVDGVRISWLEVGK